MRDGSVDFTDPKIHEMANPAYGVSIRPAEILNDSLQALNDPQQRKDFFAKSLNVYSSAMRAYFDIDEFRKSDQQYTWTLDELAKLPIDWYGGNPACVPLHYLLNIAMVHGVHHRGQISQILDTMGIDNDFSGIDVGLLSVMQ